MSTRDPASSALGAAARELSAKAEAQAVTGIARIFPVFSIAFALVYFYGVWVNSGVIRYYPNVNEWSLSPLSGDVGPPMFWYGWLVNGFVGGVVASAAAMLAPRDWFERLWSRWAWAATAVAAGLILALFYLLREYFFR